MKKYLKPLYNSSLGVYVRNFIGFRPPKYHFQKESSFLLSYLFVWRTDQGFTTIFKASDIIKKFYGEESCLVLAFFDQNGNEIFQKTLQFKQGLAEIIIDSDFIGTESIGTFCALNTLLNDTDIDIKATNRCYVGYGKNGSFSMVHGNLLALYTKKLVYVSKRASIPLKPAISSRKGKYKYYLQKSNWDFFENNLIFTNPLDRDINVTICDTTYQIRSKCCKIFSVDKNKEIIEVESDFIFPRPLIFSECNQYIDVHHG